MDGSFFEELRQFDTVWDEKPTFGSTTSQSSVVNTAFSGLYQDEESIDLTTILDACETATSSPASVFSPPQVSPVYTTPDLVSSSISPNLESTFSFSAYPPVSMYGNENYQPMLQQSPPNPTITHSSMEPLAGTRPAPGKMMSRKGKKDPPVKNTEEWRQKRDRNNVAVRKSREKSKRRIQETEFRVKELEEENRQLQSKITLLTKELNVLKSLFTSAGVAQPSLCVKEELAQLP